MTAKEEMHQQLQYCNGVTEFKQVLRTRRPKYLGNKFAADVMNHAWERKFVYCSVETLCAVRIETKKQASHYCIQGNKNQTM